MTHTGWGLYEQIMREQIMRDEDMLQLRAEEIHQTWHHCTHMWALASRAALLVEENSSVYDNCSPASLGVVFLSPNFYDHTKIEHL